ncbi:MAG: hypothetical protein ROO73_01930 [Roseivirga sp.]
MRKRDLEDQDTQRFFSEVFKSMPEEPNNSTDSTYTPKYSTAEIDQQWKAKFDECQLKKDEKETLKTLLDSFRDKKECLLKLLKWSPYQRNFLRVLCMEDKEEQKSLLKSILLLHSKEPMLAKKTIERYEDLNTYDIMSIGRHVRSGAFKLKAFSDKLIKAWYEEHSSARTK